MWHGRYLVIVVVLLQWTFALYYLFNFVVTPALILRCCCSCCRGGTLQECLNVFQIMRIERNIWSNI